MATTQIMELVKSFLEENDSENLVEAWMEKQQDVEKITKKTRKTSNKTSPKDPNKPKRGRSAYIYFCSENRATIKDGMEEDAKPADVMREMGAVWRELKDSTSEESLESIKKYSQMASDDKKRHAKEMESYVPLNEDEISALKPKKSTKKNSKKKDGSPKRARSAYIFFCSELRSKIKDENPDAISKDILKMLGALWSEYKEEEEYTEDYERFKEMASQDKDRYKQEMENFSQDSEKEIPKEVVEIDDVSTEEEIVTKPKKQRRKKEEVVEEEVEEEEVVEIDDVSTEEEIVTKPKKQRRKKEEVVEEEVVEEEVVEEEVEEEEVEEEVEEEEVEEEVVVKEVVKISPKKSSAKKNQAYMNFCKDNRQDMKDENPESSSLDITRMLGEEWKKMEIDEREEWA